MKKIISLFVLIVASLMLTSCAKSTTSSTTTNNTNQTTTTKDNITTTDQIEYDEDFTFFEKLYMNEEKKLYVFNRSESLNNYQLHMLQAIQGIYSRTASKYYLYETNSIKWLEDMETSYGYTFENTTMLEMLEDFKVNYSSHYVLYDYENNKESYNCASTIAGAFDILPVDKSLRTYVENLGFEMFVDASEMTEKQCFKRYKEYLNNTGLVQQRQGLLQLRDYGIACKYFFFFQEGKSSDILQFRGTVQGWVEYNSPVFGWVPNDEGEDVTVSSNFGQFTLASDYIYNLSVYSCENAYGDLVFKQNAQSTSIKAEQGKHYVTIMLSDGDNIQWLYNGYATNKNLFAHDENLSFPMGFSMQPAMIDLAPNILNYIYRKKNVNDYFVASVSGVGYIYPQVYPCLESYLKGVDLYLEKMDASVVQILDSGPSMDVVNEYSKMEHLKGAIYCYGYKYAQGAGSVYWANDKPFVSIRETLWDASVEGMANRINSYKKDPTTIEGYTAINLHAWSMNYNDVCQLVSLLDENVVVVTAEDFIRLITENVPHKNQLLV